MRIAVLDVYDGSGAVKPTELQNRLTQRLLELGYAGAVPRTVKTPRSEWDPVEASQAAQAHGADAALVGGLWLEGDGPDPRKAEDAESLYSEPAGRRNYYARDLFGEGYRGPRVLASVRLIDAKSGKPLYGAEVALPARDLSEATLADMLLEPLEN